ncbi:MAG: hypothetical protein JW808_11685 [Victivallales bacterium]|nr:hypothetical protein [Victivallales bacterium]
MSTPRERALASIGHVQPEKIPHQIGFTSDAHRKMCEFYGDPDFGGKIGNCIAGLNLDSFGWEEVGDCIWRDEFGVLWNRKVDKDIGVVCNQVVDLDAVESFEFPPLPSVDLMSRIAGLRDAHPDKLAASGFGFSLFERAWTLAGMENILIWMVAEPKALHRLLDRILENNIARIKRILETDVDMVYFGDDWGQQSGLIMGPDLWRQFIKPRVKEMYGMVKKAGKFVMIHSCGKVQEIFPDLIEIGLDVFNPFQPEVMDPFEMKKQFGKELCFNGGISTQRTLPYGTPEEVREETLRLIEEVGEAGGLIIAPAHAIPGDAKPENIHAMLEAIKNQ